MGGPLNRALIKVSSQLPSRDSGSDSKGGHLKPISSRHVEQELQSSSSGLALEDAGLPAPPTYPK